VWLKDSSISPVDAGTYLRSMDIIKSLLEILSTGILSLDNIQKRLIDQDNNYRRLYLQEGEKVCIIALENLLALMAYAKRPLNNSSKQIPLLYLQVQLWQRELSGILRYFQKEPEFVWRHSLKKDEDRIALPMYFCRECGASGWISRRLATDDRYCSDIATINKAFMNREKEIMLLNIESKKHEAVDEYIDNYDKQAKYLEIIKKQAICFSVFVYNVQPGIVIDYATGDSHLEESDIISKVDPSCDYIINKKTMKFHLPSCDSVKDISDKNKWYFTGERQKLIDEGYTPCKNCNP
jgi:hypothetical protein